jgi:hypothetical protein
LAHPITVVAVSSLLSALLIPWISARMNDRRLINDARLQECLSILKNTSEADQRLNTLVTTMEIFLKDSASIGEITRQDRQQIRTELARQYQDFDRQVWWWWSRLPTEARLLRIVVDTKDLNKIVDEYQTNIRQSTKALDGLWNECLRKDLRPNVAFTRTEASPARLEISRLQGKRLALTGRLVSLFAPREPSIQRLLSQQ